MTFLPYAVLAESSRDFLIAMSLFLRIYYSHGYDSIVMSWVSSFTMGLAAPKRRVRTIIFYIIIYYNKLRNLILQSGVLGDRAP